ncbi:fibronectin type 3 and ankyrin repeat domains protein 1-like [Mytilus trossulus]|uniref:fibronectin type 3 and ankyrin repeat domains protein 1-like n=1 Tax=Mytilus trossulus TaxID=6551 RepID=UPI0030059A6E
MTPLMFAAERGHLEVVTYLVTHGRQLDATSTLNGMTPLMLAAINGHLEVMTYLVTHGSQLDTTDKYGETALHYAARNGWIDVTKWLIDQGCSPWVKSKQGKTPYDLAISGYGSEEKKKEVIDFLKYLDDYVKLFPPGIYNQPCELSSHQRRLSFDK